MGNCLGNSAVELEPPRSADGEAGTEKRVKQEARMDRSIQSSGSEQWIIIADGIEALSNPADAMCRKRLGEKSGDG
ncbi:MAG: hypothetical protein GY862_25800 [Gammaproteobacteria bacterium]|nr:hypothetical protein [Gammaproteobacteria bacterium]